MKGRDWRTIAMVEAECEECGTRWGARNAWGVAVQHARRHDHKVRIEVSRVYIYNDPQEKG